MRRTANALQRRADDFRAWLDKMEGKLQDKCDFKSGIEDIPGDGLCVINVDTTQVAPLWTCISEIERVGRLSEEAHNNLCI